jgi:PPOX class probable F420-dependent enzyme
MATLSEKARAFLNEKRFAVLATLNADGSVQQTTMWYLLEGDTIVMNTKVGRVKERNLRRDPRISICVEDGYRYLTISGTAEFVDDQATAQRDIYHLAVRYQGEEGAAQRVAEQFAGEQRLTVRLTPERIIEDL